MNNTDLNTDFFDLNPLPSWIYDYETLQIEKVNKAAIAHYGYSKEEFLTLNLRDLRPVEEIPKLLNSHATVKKETGNIYFGIFIHKKKDGSLINMEINGHRVDFKNKKCMLAVCQDITEKIQQQQLILQSEQRFKALVLEGGDMISIIDSNGKYTYTSPTTTNILGITPEEFQNKTIFDFIHPDDAETAAGYMSQILKEKRVVVAPFRLRDSHNQWRWIETVLTNMLNHPAVNGIVANSRDITKQKKEEHQLKLLSSVITNTKDSIVVTEIPLDGESDPKIIYTNHAFTEMTGYTAHEVLGKTTKFLQGPLTSQTELNTLSEAKKRGESCEITILNYKKDGEEFWNNFTVSPIVDENGNTTHWIAIQRDVTEQKQKELEKELIQKISLNFSSEIEFHTTAKLLCQTICEYGNVDLVELWMPNIENTNFQLVASKADSKEALAFCEATKEIKTLKINEDILGYVWSKKETQFWENSDTRIHFLRKEAAAATTIKNATAIPLLDNHTVLGILVVASTKDRKHIKKHLQLLEQLKAFIGAEIKRKKLENDLQYLYNTIPDILCITDLNGRFLKMNKAGCDLLEYTEKELLFQPFYHFTVSEDHDRSITELEDLTQGHPTLNFENRYRTKSGKIIWLSWTSRVSSEEGLIYATAKNITKEKKLKELNRQTRELAKVGAWEYDIVQNHLFWSEEVHRLHETDPETFVPDLNTAIDFYHEEHKECIAASITKSLTEGVYLDYEAIIINNSKKERWIRVIGTPEYENGVCVKFVGSFQDITDRKEEESRLQVLSDNIPGVVYQYIIHPDKREEIKNLSKGAEKIWGYTANQIMNNIDLAWDQIRAGGDYEEVLQSIQDSIISKKNWSCRFRSIDPSGNQKTIQGFGKPEFAADGTILYNSILLDVTQESKNEKLLEQVTKIAKIGSWEFDILEEKIYWSNTVYEIHEAHPSHFEPSLKDGIKFYRHDFRALLKEKIKLCISTGVPFDIEAVIITAKNNEKWVRSIGNAEIINGVCTRLFGSFQDIHDQKTMEFQKNSLQNTIENSLNEIYLFNAHDFKFNYLNRGALSNIGYTMEEMKELTPLDIKPDYTLETFKELVSPLVKKEKEKIVFFTHHKRKDNSLYPVEVHLQLITDNNEKRFLAIILDITERKKSESKILQANERFEKVTEATNDAIWDFDVANNTLFWGKGFQTLFGYDLEIIQPSFEFLVSRIHPDDTEWVTNKMNHYMQDSNLKNWHEEYRFIKADGGIAFVIDRATFLRNSKGKVTRVIGAMTDISEQKNHEAQLIALNESLQAYAKELERSNEELEQFAFITSHDLQEPLRMISSFMDQLKRKYENQLDDKAIKYIDFATDGAKRMKQIILDLLEYSRAGRPTDLIEEVDINEIIADFKLLRSKIIDEKSVSITSHTIPMVKTYKTGITQVFHSLLDNAIKYSKKDIPPKIAITVKEATDKWIFAIKDNGIGIEEKFFSKIFIIFQRLHNREEYEGTGIGLSIVKRHIDFLGGKIWLESELGAGTTFFFELPKTNHQNPLVN